MLNQLLRCRVLTANHGKSINARMPAPLGLLAQKYDRDKTGHNIGTDTIVSQLA